VQSKTADSKRVMEILVRPRAVTFQRYCEAMDAKLGHGPCPPIEQFPAPYARSIGHYYSCSHYGPDGGRLPAHQGICVRTHFSLIYVVGYLLTAGICLLVAPRLAMKLLFSTADYGVILPRLAGLLLIGLGMFVVQIVRHRVVALYATTLAVRVVFCVGFIALYILSRDPLFLVLLAVVGLGVLATSASYILDRREGVH
jgi:hypothetical protein